MHNKCIPEFIFLNKYSCRPSAPPRAHGRRCNFTTVSSQQALLPPLCPSVRCPHLAHRPEHNDGVGAANHGGVLERREHIHHRVVAVRHLAGRGRGRKQRDGRE